MVFYPRNKRQVMQMLNTHSYGEKFVVAEKGLLTRLITASRKEDF